MWETSAVKHSQYPPHQGPAAGSPGHLYWSQTEINSRSGRGVSATCNPPYGSEEAAVKYFICAYRRSIETAAAVSSSWNETCGGGTSAPPQRSGGGGGRTAPMSQWEKSLGRGSSTYVYYIRGHCPTLLRSCSSSRHVVCVERGAT